MKAQRKGNDLLTKKPLLTHCVFPDHERCTKQTLEHELHLCPGIKCQAYINSWQTLQSCAPSCNIGF